MSLECPKGHQHVNVAFGLNSLSSEAEQWLQVCVDQIGGDVQLF